MFIENYFSERHESCPPGARCELELLCPVEVAHEVATSNFLP